MPCLALATLIGGWFYVVLKFEYGAATAFNRTPESSFALGNQPKEFYLGLSPEQLFTRPIRSNFANQLLPIFYSEIWGDYWSYFAVRRERRSVLGATHRRKGRHHLVGNHAFWLETSSEKKAAYLGRVNFVSLLPTGFCLAAIIFAISLSRKSRAVDRHGEHQREIIGFLLLAIATSLGGYFWFLVMLPNPGKGDTIKASYMLHIFPFVAILAANLLQRIEGRSRTLYRGIVGGLLLIFAHNSLAMLTQYPLVSPYTRWIAGP